MKDKMGNFAIVWAYTTRFKDRRKAADFIRALESGDEELIKRACRVEGGEIVFDQLKLLGSSHVWAANMKCLEATGDENFGTMACHIFTAFDETEPKDVHVMEIVSLIYVSFLAYFN